MNDNFLYLGKVLKARRNELGYSLRGVANRAGISHTELYNIEEGIRVAPSFITIINLCNILQLDINELLIKIGYDYDTSKYKIKFKKVDENCIEITSKNLNKALEILFGLEFDLDELLPSIGKEIEMTISNDELSTSDNYSKKKNIL